MTPEELNAMRDRVYDRFNKTGDGGFGGFHEKAAKAYRQHGEIENAEAAERLAEKYNRKEKYSGRQQA